MPASAQAATQSRTIHIPGATIVLAPGERYSGIILAAYGVPSHHLILLPGDIEGDWKAAKYFAARAGGELPSRREQSLLIANLKGEFKEELYWSAEQYAGDADCAWAQKFRDGFQGDVHKDSTFRARAVRRIAIR